MVPFLEFTANFFAIIRSGVPFKDLLGHVIFFQNYL